MKCLIILFFKFLLLSNFVMAETIPTKSKILKQSFACIENSQTQVCKDLVYEIEKVQLLVFDQNNFKCQSSLLGLQSEIIETYYLKNFLNKRTSFMIPYVIKNC